MNEELVSHRISPEGADLLTLSGVNDANLVELAKQCGVKVALRGRPISVPVSASTTSKPMPRRSA